MKQVNNANAPINAIYLDMSANDTGLDAFEQMQDDAELKQLRASRGQRRMRAYY